MVEPANTAPNVSQQSVVGVLATEFVGNHPGPESSVASRKAAIEALIGTHAGKHIDAGKHIELQTNREDGWATPQGKHEISCPRAFFPRDQLLAPRPDVALILA